MPDVLPTNPCHYFVKPFAFDIQKTTLMHLMPVCNSFARAN